MKPIITTGNLHEWAKAHVFYNVYTHTSIDKKCKPVLDEFKWRKKTIKQAPHGKLLTRNSFFENLKKDKVYLAHITPNFYNICQDNKLYPSAGCLVGSIYCTPVIKEGHRFRLHNLGKFILKRDMPIHLGLSGKRVPKRFGIFLIEIELPEVCQNNLIGIDYLRLGEIHFNIYRELECLLSSQERYQLEEICVNRIRRAFEYLSLCNKAYYYDEKINPLEFMRLFSKAIPHLPTLGYFYFEALSEYIMLYQDNNQALKYNQLGEFYSPSYKELVYALCSKLGKNFSLRQFNPTLSKVVEYIQKNSIISDAQTKDIASYLTKRLIFLTNARLFSANSRLIDWQTLNWSFNSLVEGMAPLLGHLIHRELRTFGRYPHFYFYFDQYKALQAWNYWNHMNIAIPFNGVIPKGEVGFNPAYPDLKYKIYNSKIISQSDFIYLEPDKKLEIQIVPQLIDLRFTLMRNKDAKKRIGCL